MSPEIPPRYRELHLQKQTLLTHKTGNTCHPGPSIRIWGHNELKIQTHAKTPEKTQIHSWWDYSWHGKNWPILKELKEWKRDRSRIFTQYRDWLKRLQNLERMETDPINQSWDTSETNTGIITTRTVNNIITKSKIQRKLEVNMANKKSNGEPSPEPKINHQEN